MFRCILCQAASIRYSGEWWACLLQSRDEILLMTSSSSTNQVVADRPEPTGEQSDPPGGDITPRRRQPHFMLVPSLACPAECSYCFGPHQGPTMSPETMEATLDFMARIADETGQRKVKVTFHGGEPCRPGTTSGGRRCKGSSGASAAGATKSPCRATSGSWTTSSASSSPSTRSRSAPAWTDRRRSPTASVAEATSPGRCRAFRTANCYGMNVGCIATFTPYSASRWREVFDFFLAERLNFSIHAAVPPLDILDGQYAISPEQYGRLLCQMLDYYVEHRREISVSSLDQMCQGFGCGDGKVCTFRDCLGMFLAIDPHGDIYPCQRFCGKPAYRLGRLADQPTLAKLLDSPVALCMAERQEQTRSACAGCNHFDYCKGGCPYNAWAGAEGRG